MIPEETWVIPGGPTFVTPAVTIPPGCLILKGYGDVNTGTEIMGPFPSGWMINNEWTGYDSCATFICPAWHYCGPVGSSAECSIHTDQTMTATHS